jgi:hypothetical protein
MSQTITVNITGPVGSGKSALAGEIEILCLALGLDVEWPEGQSEKNMTGADWQSALENYKPRVVIGESIPQAKASPESALDCLVSAMERAVDEAPLNEVLSLATGLFVNLVTELCKYKGHDDSLPITVDGGTNRNVTIHPPKVPVDTVQVFGVKGGVETLIGTAPMPARMKARELAREQFGHFEDGDGSEAELCFGAMEQLIEHMSQCSDAGKGLVV